MSIKSIFNAQYQHIAMKCFYLAIYRISAELKKIYLRQFMNLFKSCASKLNTV